MISLALLAAATALSAQWLKPPKWTVPPKKPATLNAGTLRQQAEGGVPSAQTGLGDLYMWGGDGFQRDEKTAVFWYRKAAELGFAEAQSNLGDCYLAGSGIKKDEWEATRWHEKAAAQGFPMAEYNLGSAYEEGRGVRRDPAKALNWYRRAADHELPVAQFYLGSVLLQANGATGEDPREAVALILKAAHAGLPQAQLGMGAVYEKGLGVERDTTSALEWYKRAADQGQPDARLRLGRAYSEGDVVGENSDIALEWLQKIAADDGPAFAAAQHELVRMCRRLRMMYGSDPGDALGTDHPAAGFCGLRPAAAQPAARPGKKIPAVKLERIGWTPVETDAEADQTAAQFRYGHELLRPGPQRDLRLAWAWLSIATENAKLAKSPSYRQASRELKDVENKLNPVQLEKARKTASAWRGRHGAP